MIVLDRYNGDLISIKYKIAATIRKRCHPRYAVMGSSPTTTKTKTKTKTMVCDLRHYSPLNNAFQLEQACEGSNSGIS